MSSTTAYEPDLERRVISGYAARAIRRKAMQLAGRNGFSISEQDDLEQELRLHLLRRLPKFDPQIAHWNVFVRTLLERHAATLVARRRASIRAHANVAQHDAAGAGALDVAIDTAAILSKLPPKTRELCERLKKDTVAEVARQLGVPRSTLRDEIKRLRKHFLKVGLEGFSESGPPLCRPAR